ncbi:hypothetical protein D3C83_95960 [compost metagenome]
MGRVAGVNVALSAACPPVPGAVSVISLPWRKPVTRLRALSSDPAKPEKLLVRRVSTCELLPVTTAGGGES